MIDNRLIVCAAFPLYRFSSRAHHFSTLPQNSLNDESVAFKSTPYPSVRLAHIQREKRESETD